MPNLDYFNHFFCQAQETISNIQQSDRSKIMRIIGLLFEVWKKNRQIFVIGNGGSASTATHFASDLVKTVVEKPGGRGIKAISLVDNIPLTSALINDWGKESLFVEQLRTFFNLGDMVVVFSVHGGAGQDKDGAWSQNILKAIQYAKDNQGKTVGFAGFNGGAMKDLCDECIVVPADSTPIVESIHVLLTHFITFKLKEMINE